MPLDPKLIRQLKIKYIIDNYDILSKSIENLPKLETESNIKKRLERLESYIDKITDIILETPPDNTINEINHNSIDLCCLPFRLRHSGLKC
jgi:hypothetical protein